jgi:DNA-binding NarL/FixJ family response regulator
MHILVADDHSLFRDGIISLLEAAGHEVVGQAGDGEAAIRAASKLKPDLVLMDINMPEVGGVEALRTIKERHPEIKVVLLTVSEEEDDLVEAARSGANGYMLKNLEGEEFLRLLSGVMQGEAAMTHKTAARLLDALSREDQSPPTALDQLTPRELDLLQLVAIGMSNKEIAGSLSISENTVKYHMKNILQKMGASNRTETVAIAIRRGILNPSVD